ncbi:MAG: tRNA lysidine(34) synthetase TilS [Acetobacteraceae bacterium]|jgi:tRNA(Ile)-lysidine synthase
MDVAQLTDLTAQFAAEMDRLGPFEPRPRLAVAVSGGADSMALALLILAWASPRQAEVLTLTVDHGLRPESSAEADLTLRRLAALGLRGRKLHIPDLARGPGLAERARNARYDVLLQECVAEGIPHLLIGHHRGDQAETVMMRVLSGSASRGLAGMPALVETRHVRLVRPLLDVAPGRLREFLTVRAVAWVEDPSNNDPAALRARLRRGRADAAGTDGGTLAITQAARAAGIRRAAQDLAIAQTLAERATIQPEGYAVLTPGPIDPESLAALLRTIAGASHAPPIDRVAVLARSLRPATLGGVRIVPAGRLGAGWLLTREPRAMQGPVQVRRGAVWDGRFRLVGCPPNALATDRASSEWTFGALGTDAARFRNRDGPPALVLHGLPALRLGETVVAIPHVGVGDERWRLLFDPRNCAAGAPFSP